MFQKKNEDGQIAMQYQWCNALSKKIQSAKRKPTLTGQLFVEPLS